MSESREQWIIRRYDGGHRLVFGDEDYVEYDHCVYEDDGDGSQYEEIEARMNLMAAAPDLLAACKAALPFLDRSADHPASNGEEYAVIDAISAAITKATQGV